MTNTAFYDVGKALTSAHLPPPVWRTRWCSIRRLLDQGPEVFKSYATKKSIWNNNLIRETSISCPDPWESFPQCPNAERGIVACIHIKQCYSTDVISRQNMLHTRPPLLEKSGWKQRCLYHHPLSSTVVNSSLQQVHRYSHVLVPILSAQGLCCRSQKPQLPSTCVLEPQWLQDTDKSNNGG